MALWNSIVVGAAKITGVFIGVYRECGWRTSWNMLLSVQSMNCRRADSHGIRQCCAARRALPPLPNQPAVCCFQIS